MRRANLQSLLCELTGAQHCKLGPEDPPHLRPMEEHARSRQPLGKKSGPQERDARGNAVAAPGANRKPGATQCRHPVRRKSARFRNAARIAEADGNAITGW